MLRKSSEWQSKPTTCVGSGGSSLGEQSPQFASLSKPANRGRCVVGEPSRFASLSKPAKQRRCAVGEPSRFASLSKPAKQRRRTVGEQSRFASLSKPAKQRRRAVGEPSRFASLSKPAKRGRFAYRALILTSMRQQPDRRALEPSLLARTDFLVIVRRFGRFECPRFAVGEPSRFASLSKP